MARHEGYSTWVDEAEVFVVHQGVLRGSGGSVYGS